MLILRFQNRRKKAATKEDQRENSFHFICLFLNSFKGQMELTMIK